MIKKNTRNHTSCCRNTPGYFGFDRDAYDNIKKGRRRKWYEELKEESKRYRSRDDLMPSVI
jgi:hypothetical protein